MQTWSWTFSKTPFTSTNSKSMREIMPFIHRSALAVGVLCLCAPAIGAQPLSMVKDDIPSASGARAIVAADFNRDGWLDVAAASVDTSSVSVLLNVRGERVASPLAVPVGTGPFAMATGDFNRDSIPDLAVTNADSASISILIGRGDGRFNRSDISIAPYRSPRGITVEDLNGDGKLDLFYSGYDSNLLQVLLGTGAGGFVKGWTLVGYAPRPQGVSAADFNRDGHVDIAVAYDSAGGLAIWYGRENTTFAPVGVAGFAAVNVLATADLNGDGWLDVAAASTNGGRVAVYLGTPSGLVFKRSYAVDSDLRGITIADVNSDGVPDVITASRSSGTVNVLLGDAAHRGALLAPVTFAAGRGSRAVVAADFDADGRVDLAAANQYAAAASLLSNTTPFVSAGYAFGELKLPASTPVATVGLMAADFNGDGTLDLVASAGWQFAPDGVMVMLTGGGNVVLPGPQSFAGFHVGDFNNDGKQDVVYRSTGVPGSADQTAQFLTYLGNGRGGFAALPPLTLSGVEFVPCSAGDIDRDARLDLVCAGYDGVGQGAFLRVLRGDGTGAFHEGQRLVLLAAAAGASPQDIQIADVNRDGSPDVIVLSSGPTDVLEVWYGDRAGRMSRGTMVDNNLEESFRGFPQCIRTADLNQDGYLDLVVYRGEGQLGVALGGASGFAGVAEVWRDWEVRYPTATSVGIADINVDGRLDLITPLGWVLHGRGDGTFEDAERFAALGQSVLVVDFTRDGLPDILHTPLIDDSDEPPAVPAFNGIRVLVNRRSELNREPIVSLADRTFNYQDLVASQRCATLHADVVEPDQHAVTFEWRDDAGVVVSDRDAAGCERMPGIYRFTLTVRDGRGAQVTRTATLTVVPGKEIVLYPGSGSSSWVMGNWSQVADATAAGGFRAYDPNRRAAKVTVPVANTGNGVLLAFVPDPTQTYRLWIRLKAERNDAANDSVWVQFSGSTDVAGTPAYRIGTTSGLAVSLEECVNCGVSGWGWEDNGWGAVNTSGVLLRFPESNHFSTDYLYIQTREDGVSIDQVVLSAEKYLTARPGAAKNDATILPRTFPLR
jgi:hypothetical protein